MKLTLAESRFLKDPINIISELVNEAKKVCKLVKLKTLSRNIEDYPCKKSPLCKWNKGQCEFYLECLK